MCIKNCIQGELGLVHGFLKCRFSPLTSCVLFHHICTLYTQYMHIYGCVYKHIYGCVHNHVCPFVYGKEATSDCEVSCMVNPASNHVSLWHNRKCTCM